METVLKGEGDVERSFDLENQIDALRNRLRAQNTIDVDEGKYSFDCGTVYVDLIRECERCGDYIVNVVESKRGKRDVVSVFDSLSIDPENKEVTLDGSPVELTRTEFEILSLLSSNPGKVYSTQALIDLIWPKDARVGAGVVDTNIRAIRTKLGDHASHIVIKPGYGYSFE